MNKLEISDNIKNVEIDNQLCENFRVTKLKRNTRGIFS